MLRKITSDTYTKATTMNSAISEQDDLASNPEIFIDRNGERFQYLLNYMSTRKVTLPLSVPCASLFTNMEYFGINYDDSDVTLSVADPKDMFHGLGRYQDFFDTRKLDIEQRYRKVAVEKLACDVALTYFSQLIYTPKEEAARHDPYNRGYGYMVADKQCNKKRICFF